MHFVRRINKALITNTLTFKNINMKGDDDKMGIVIDEQRVKKKME